MSKKPVNRNFIWAQAFVNQLYGLGVRYACISPGSRSTPLTVAFANQKGIKCFVNIDERVSGFFALGLAKATDIPVTIVTTSGTATSELYPAIIEAFQQRVPLIICTADRPLELLNVGANQTINQWNLYRNHIRWFKNVGSPDLSAKKITSLRNTAIKAFEISSNKNKGPVHLNFPFRKPLEPNTFSDEIDADSLMEALKPITFKNKTTETSKLTKKEEKQVRNIANYIIEKPNGLIVVGPMGYDPTFRTKVKLLSKTTRYPIIAEGVSHIRFNNNKSDNFVCVNYDAFLRSTKFKKNHKPEFVLQFGRTVTSGILEKYLTVSNPLRFLINDFGDIFDPSNKSRPPLKFSPSAFIENLIQILKDKNLKRMKNYWIKDFETVDTLAEGIKTKLLKNSGIRIEPGIIQDVISIIPSNTKIMVGNSLPIRDFDGFIGKTTKNFEVYFNRGASGIDGVTSTALGIASIKKPTVLITGDLSFIHDLNALLPAKRYSIQLIVILINNNGGGIFEMLPISSNKKWFKEYFKTPHNLNISSIVKSFGLEHHIIKSKKDLQNKLNNSLKNKSFAVLEIKTDSDSSKKLRKNYWANAIKQIETEFS
ncbi:MAG: 2-succinyl-5-enolpyruvyl-6-hydroxy-3-cyclohexene-1-carboxylic-acid synthase [Bacteroidetes bacterium]|nr:2-succinyl-5-enolpyruvyl-6-hydroxy-3-cyclohexene-1-carboxylic-acid synthase [Bacteroidota bacterium]